MSRAVASCRRLSLLSFSPRRVDDQHDVEMVDSDRDAIQLYVEHNLRTPLGRLPDDLLIDIAQCVAGDFVKPRLAGLSTMTSIYARLRSLLIGTPGLWCSVSLTWPDPVLECYTTRARECPLKVTATQFSQEKVDQTRRHLVQWLPRSGVVHVRIRASMAVYITGVLAAVAAPLQSLTIACDQASRVPFCLHPSSCNTITTLDLLKISVQSIPCLPVLRVASFRGTDASLDTFWDLFRGSPALHSLTLRYALDHKILDDISSPVRPPFGFPRLQNVTLVDDIEVVAALLDLVPDPCISFQVEVVEANDKIWSSRTGPNRRILERLIRFRDTYTNQTGSFSVGRVEVINHKRAELQNIGANIECSSGTALIGEPYVRYLHQSRHGVVKRDELLDDISTLEINYSVDMNPRHFDIECLPGIRQLVLHFIVTDCTDICPLEAWVMHQHQQGHPLESVAFDACSDSVKPFFDRISAAGAARTMRWIPDGLT
jgi:hypothetical protein